MTKLLDPKDVAVIRTLHYIPTTFYYDILYPIIGPNQKGVQVFDHDNIPEDVDHKPQLVLFFTPLLDGDRSNHLYYHDEIFDAKNKLSGGEDTKVFVVFTIPGTDPVVLRANVNSDWGDPFYHAEYNLNEGSLNRDEKWKTSTRKILDTMGRTEHGQEAVKMIDQLLGHEQNTYQDIMKQQIVHEPIRSVVLLLLLILLV